MNKYDLVIFDLDGTILDTSEGIISSIKYTIDTMKLERLSDESISSFIGPPIQDSFARECGLNGDALEKAITIFRTYYKTNTLFKASPYNGIYEVFQTLTKRNIQTAIATYKREDFAKTILEHFEFDKYTRNIHGGDAENKLKKSDIIDLCISDSKISDRSRIVMIGDTHNDAIGAEQAKIDFIGITYGFGFDKIEDKFKPSINDYADKAIDILNYI